MTRMLISFNIQRDGTGNGSFNINDTFAERLLLQMSVLHQIMCLFKAGISNQVHMIAGKKVHDVSDPNQNKGFRKTSQR